MKAVIFCGGDALQLTAEGQAVPKPMVLIGQRPVLWHVMRTHAAWGTDDFILCLGRGGDLIKRFFLDYQEALTNDFVLTGSDREVHLLGTDIEPWRITFADTGMQAPVLNRLRAARTLIGDDEFFCASYGDVLTDAPFDQFIDDFRSRDCLAAVLAVRPPSRAHLLESGSGGAVTAVHTMGSSDLWGAGGYFIFRRAIFDELRDDTSLLDGLLPRLAEEGQLLSYQHEGFWSGMDTLREVQQLNALQEAGTAPWDPIRWPGRSVRPALARDP